MGLLDQLTKEEKQYFLAALAEVKKKKRNVKKAEQVREIIPIDKWLENEYYVGADGARVYDYWKEQLSEIFGSEKGRYNEVIVTGAIGTGKSTFAIVAMLRKIYELSCFINIPAIFSLMSSSMIVFIYFSLSKIQANLTGYGQFRSLLDSVPYFNRHFERDKKLDSLLKFPENILFTSGSSASHAIGMNMIGSILDEANFFRGETVNPDRSVAAQDYSKIAELYSSIINRAKSRFMEAGKDESLSILVSSATHSSSFTMKRIEASLDDPHTKIIDSRLWEVKPKGTYSDKRFWVFKGSESLDPTIIENSVDLNPILESKNLRPIKFKTQTITNSIAKMSHSVREEFVAIPVDFRKSFRTDIFSSLRDIAGVSIAPVGRLFSAKSIFYEACKKELEHPFTKDVFEISTKSEIKVDFYLKKLHVFPNAHLPHFIHIDQSETSDSTGFAMSHISNFLEDEGVRKPIVTLDLMVRIDPPRPPRKISIGKVRDFIFYLRDIQGINIGKVTYDWYACLCGDHTRCITKTGIKKIKDLNIGESVRTEQGWRLIKNKFEYKDAPTIKIKTKQGTEIEMTSNHRIRILDKMKRRNYLPKITSKRFPVWKWEKACNLKIGDILYIPKTLTKVKGAVEIKGKFRTSQRGMMKDVSMPKTFDKDFAYIMGYYLGDGYLINGINFGFGTKKEVTIFRNKVNKYFGIEKDFYKVRKNFYVYSIYSRFLERFVNHIGFKKVPACEKEIPEIVFKSPISVIKSFMAGYIDSDGHVDETGRVEITTSSLKIAKQLKILFTMALGIQCSYSAGYNKKYNREYYYFKITDDRRLLHDFPSDKIQNNLSNIKGRVIFERIKSIYKSRADVYDIEVDEVGSYYANGIYSHNSQESRQVLDEAGVTADHQSVDRSDDQYLGFCNLLYEGRIKTYFYRPFYEEFFDLKHNRKRRKVDHPVGGSKDVSDAVVGSVNNAIESCQEFSEIDKEDYAMMFDTEKSDKEDLMNWDFLMEDVE